MALIMTKSADRERAGDTSRAASSMQITVPTLKITACPEFSQPSEV